MRVQSASMKTSVRVNACGIVLPCYSRFTLRRADRKKNRKDFPTRSAAATACAQRRSLTLAPGRRRKARPSRSEFLRPDNYFLSVLPLEQHHFVRDLEAIRIDLEAAEARVVVQLEDGRAHFFAVDGAGALDGLDDHLAPCVTAGGMVGKIRARIVLPVGLDEFAGPRVLARDRYQPPRAQRHQFRLPLGGPVDELRGRTQSFVKLRKVSA